MDSPPSGPSKSLKRLIYGDNDIGYHQELYLQDADVDSDDWRDFAAAPIYRDDNIGDYQAMCLKHGDSDVDLDEDDDFEVVLGDKLFQLFDCLG